MRLQHPVLYARDDVHALHWIERKTRLLFLFKITHYYYLNFTYIQHHERIDTFIRC